MCFLKLHMDYREIPLNEVSLSENLRLYHKSRHGARIETERVVKVK